MLAHVRSEQESERRARAPGGAERCVAHCPHQWSPEASVAQHVYVQRRSGLSADRFGGGGRVGNVCIADMMVACRTRN
jgi:hypothetical protein